MTRLHQRFRQASPRVRRYGRVLPASWLSLLRVVLAASATLLAWRAYWGPFTWGVHVGSPLNLEGLAACSLLLSALWAQPERDGGKPEPAWGGWTWIGLVLVVAGALYWPALSFPLVSDDYELAPQLLNAQMARDAFTRGGGDGWFRPLPLLSLGWQAHWAGQDVWRWHLPGLFLHLACSVVLFALVKRLFGRVETALIAAALFAFHGSHPEAVSWMTSRFDLMATFFVLFGLLAYLRFHDDGGRASCVAAFACCLAGLLSKEMAYVFPALVMLLLVGGRRVTPRDWTALVALLALEVAVFAYRWSLFGGIGGYTDAQTGSPVFFHGNAVGMVKTLFWRCWALLFFPLNWSVAPQWWVAGTLALTIPGLVVLTGTHVSRRRVLACAGLVIVALLPGVHLALLGQDLSGTGRYYLASAGWAVLLGVIIAGVPRPATRWAVAGVLCVFQVAALAHNLLIWGDVAHLAERTCREMAQALPPEPREVSVRDLPPMIHGVYFFRNGFAPCLAWKAGHATGPVLMNGAAPVPPGMDQWRWRPGESRLVWEKSR